ncbi:MAG: hypothetical protein IJ214_05685 [Clostridia bacterium]|nr:hypothetical protein [Clostridia bacterium]
MKAQFITAEDPYLIYDGVLVWKSLHALSLWLNRPELAEQAENVRKAIQANCVFEHEEKNTSVWSVDLNGHWNIYDEPPGSLHLLPFYGFCAADDPIWQATVSPYPE